MSTHPTILHAADVESGSGGEARIMIRQEITIVNEEGLHARPAAQFVLAARAFRSQIWLVKGEERFSAASILDVLTANLNCGETAVIEAKGPDAEEAVKRLVQLTAEFRKRDLNSTRTASRRAEEDF
jgi:phosphotransferase system HPr (HPr) family protein